MQVGFVNGLVSIVEGGWLTQDQASQLQQAILLLEGRPTFICQRAKDYMVFYTVGLTTERYTIFSFDSANNLLTKNY